MIFRHIEFCLLRWNLNEKRIWIYLVHVRCNMTIWPFDTESNCVAVFEYSCTFMICIYNMLCIICKYFAALTRSLDVADRSTCFTGDLGNYSSCRETIRFYKNSERLALFTGKTQYMSNPLHDSLIYVYISRGKKRIRIICFGRGVKDSAYSKFNNLFHFVFQSYV